MTNETLGAVLERQAARFPGKDFIVFPDRNLRFTYGSFDARVNTLARGLLSVGIGQGDHVGIWATNVPDWLTYLFAAAKIGAITVTVNTSYRTHELDYLVRQSDIKALCLINGFRDSDYVAMVNELIPELKLCERGNLASARFPKLRTVIFMGPEKHRGMYTTPELLLLGAHAPDGPGEPAAASALTADQVINMQYTSGTTGFPKGVMLTHHNIVNNGFAIGERQRFSADERVCAISAAGRSPDSRSRSTFFSWIPSR
ncbi:MAG: AMP-binding protein [Spirochaetia bacterium]